MAALGALLPFTPLARLLGFSTLPVTFFLILLGMVLTYLALVEFAKSRFYATERGRPVGVAPRQDQRMTRRLRRTAGRFLRHSVS